MSSKATTGGAIVIALIILITAYLITPIISIWALNDLFNLSIPVNVWTYLSALWLHLTFAPPTFKKS